MKKIRLGIIGCGNIGSQHYSNVLSGKCPEISITAVADLNPDRLDWARANYEKYRAQNPDISEISLYSSAEELMKSGKVDAVVIATPHYFHPPLAIEAMKHGLHVMCEKPAGVYTLQVREMIAEADKHPELKFGMMFNQRTNCLYKKMKEIIDSGELGDLKRSTWIITNWYRPQAYYDSGDWRATWCGEGGGVLLNQCPHNLDLWQWLCGMPVKVYAKMKFGKYHDIEVEDDVVATVEYENGAMGTFITSTADTPGSNRLEIVFDGGTLICENNQLILKKLAVMESKFSKENTAVYGRPECHTYSVETDGSNPQHTGVMNAFAASILRGEPLVADGREGLNALMLSNAMHLSAWLGREVDIPFDEDRFKDLLEEKIKGSKHKENIKNVFSEFDKNHGNLCFF